MPVWKVDRLSQIATAFFDHFHRTLYSYDSAIILFKLSRRDSLNIFSRPTIPLVKFWLMYRFSIPWLDVFERLDATSNWESVIYSSKFKDYCIKSSLWGFFASSRCLSEPFLPVRDRYVLLEEFQESRATLERALYLCVNWKTKFLESFIYTHKCHIRKPK